MTTATRRRLSEQEAKAAHLAKMDEVAKCIVDPVPSWLSEVLSDWSFDVRSQDSIDQMWPTRKQMWDSLARACNLAIELQDLFRDPAMPGFLVTNSKLESEEYLKHLASELSKFAGYAAEACRSPLLVGKNGKVLSGASKPLLPGVMPAKYVCAAIIAEVIAFFVVPDILLSSRDGSHAIALTGKSTLISIDLISGVTSKSWRLREKIEGMASSADGKFVATLDEAATLRAYLWNTTNSVGVYPGQDRVNSFDFVGTANMLVVGERGGAFWLWEPSVGGGKRRRLDSGDPRGSIDVIAVSPDGETVATASGAITPGISLWKPFSRVPSIGTIPGQRALTKLAFSVDGRFLVSSSNSGETKYWRLAGTGTSRAVLARDWQPFPLPGRLYTIKRKPAADEFIVGGDHGVLQVWRSSSLEGKPDILASERRAALAQVSDQDRFVNGGRNFLQTGHVMAVAVSRNGSRFATVDPYGFALVWPIGKENAVPALVPSPNVSNAAFSVALSPGGDVLAVGATSTVTYVHRLGEDGAAIKSVQIASPGDKTVRALLFLDETRLLVCNDDGRISLWTLVDPPWFRTIVEAGPAVTALAQTADGRVAVGRGDQVDVIDCASADSKPVSVSKGLGPVYSLALSDDGKLLAAGFEDGAIRIWSFSEPGRPPISLAVHKDATRALAFDRSGETIVSVGDDGMIRSSVVGPRKLADLACGVLWRELDADEMREFFGASNPPILPTCRRGGAP